MSIGKIANLWDVLFASKGSKLICFQLSCTLHLTLQLTDSSGHHLTTEEASTAGHAPSTKLIQVPARAAI